MESMCVSVTMVMSYFVYPTGCEEKTS